MMLDIDTFVHACLLNKVTEALDLLDEGVDINGGNYNGKTGLMGAMMMGSMEVVEILLARDDLILDTTDNSGKTALHYACIYNRVESLKLFLEHPGCRRDLVVLKTISGNTAEVLADKKGNNDCARLIREFVQDTEEIKSIDDLVEFITGKSEKKNNRKRQKQPVQVDADCKTTTDNATNRNEVDIEPVDSLHNEALTDIASCTTRSLLDVKLDSLLKAEVFLGGQIAEKEIDLEKYEQNLDVKIDGRLVEMENLIAIIEKTKKENDVKQCEVQEIDKELSDLEVKMFALKLRKTKVLEEKNKDVERVKQYEEEKYKLEVHIEKQLSYKEKENVIKGEIQDLEKKLHETRNSINYVTSEISVHDRASNKLVEPNKEFLEFIDTQIYEKERELECPVCLEVAVAPILMCSEQHLICSGCRPKMKNCPECRKPYTGTSRRHRYAEKTAEQLSRLRDKRWQVMKSCK